MNVQTATMGGVMKYGEADSLSELLQLQRSPEGCESRERYLIYGDIIAETSHQLVLVLTQIQDDSVKAWTV